MESNEMTGGKTRQQEDDEARVDTDAGSCAASTPDENIPIEPVEPVGEEFPSPQTSTPDADASLDA